MIDIDGSSLPLPILHNCDAYVIVYSERSYKSFKVASQILRCCQISRRVVFQSGGQNSQILRPIILLAVETDDKQEVKIHDGLILATTLGCQFQRTSLPTKVNSVYENNINVTPLFTTDVTGGEEFDSVIHSLICLNSTMKHNIQSVYSSQENRKAFVSSYFLPEGLVLTYIYESTTYQAKGFSSCYLRHFVPSL